MPVYVDNAVTLWRGRRWAHLMADTLDELHAMAADLGMPRRAFQDKTSGAHYDVDSDLREQYYPQYSATLDASWSLGSLTVAYGLNWFSETDRFTSETLAGDPDYSDPRYFHVKPKWEHDINVAYDITESVNLYAGVNNLFDEQPEYGYSSYPVSAMGRYFYLGARVNFGAAVR